VAGNLVDATPEQINGYKQFWADYNIEIVGMQALLFGHPELTVFDTAEARRKTIDYLARVMAAGAKLGARAFVFGSPKNRLVEDRAPAEVELSAAEFFSAVSDFAEQLGIYFCLEPVPPEYGADWLTDTVEAVAWIEKHRSPGLRINLDTGCLALNGDNPTTVIPKALPVTGHVHLSESHLVPPGTTEMDHEAIAAALRLARYDGVVSIEMKAADSDNLERVVDAVEFVKETYSVS
jgi:D-psicose/D-tagatose/L-ribulose 3-epimerase